MSGETSKRVVRAVAIWFPTVVLGLFFILQGVMKLGPSSPWEAKFAGWGLPAGMVVVIGVVELVGGLGLLVPRVATWAALLLGGTMLGALATHLLHGEWLNVGVTLVLAIVFGALARARRPQALGLGRFGGDLVAPTAEL